jgi:gamma-glutamylcyclotransferase (GGCT)/AIG2-like uncharacterized protein YtfP
MKVFVYGTLMRDHGNNYLLKDATFLGAAVTGARYAMTNVGFPFVIRASGDDAAPVAGELFDIGDCAETLARLDRLEGEGRMYDRVTGPVLCNGEIFEASYYVKHDNRRDGEPVAPNSDGVLVWPGRRRAA